MLTVSDSKELKFMLHETLKDLRKKKGYSQEEAAARLNVVRQTVSKWEKGLSVPDADALVRLSELYEVTVGDLLGAPPASDETAAPSLDMREIAEQLSRINEQLVIRNRRSSRIWKIVGGVVIGWVLVYVIVTVLSVALFSVRWEAVTNEESNVRIEDFFGLESDSPLP